VVRSAWPIRLTVPRGGFAHPRGGYPLRIATDSTTLDEHLTLAGDSVAPAAARQFVRQSGLDQRLRADRGDDLELLVSELVTNVVRHAGTDMVLTLRADSEQVCLSVEDLSSQMPQMRENPGETGGWGLRLVDQLASRWGITRTSSGKRVWVLLARDPRPGEVGA
jgi:anti-sigma regulatory factor (Ser/Thr protein kinase)